jgi:hypothetical protein
VSEDVSSALALSDEVIDDQPYEVWMKHCFIIECSVEEVLHLGDHHLFVGKVLAAQAESEAFEDAWLLEDDDYKPLHYLGSELYAILGERRQAQLRTSEEGGVELEETAEERERRQEEEARRREQQERDER